MKSGPPGSLSLFGLVALIGMIACTTDTPPTPVAGGEPWTGTIATEGDVTTVINESGSVWQGTAVLVEEASIGVASGRDPYMFGRVSSVAASDGRIYVADRQVPALRVYDWSGRYLRDIGRRGQGPGEFQSVLAVGVDGEQRVWLEDVVAARILVFSSDGEPLATVMKKPPLVANLSRPMVVTAEGRGFVAAAVRETEETLGRSGVIPYAIDGTVGDFVDVRYPEGKDPPVFLAEIPKRGAWGVSVPLYPRSIAEFTPAPAVLTGYPDEYRFRIDYLDGRATIVERRGARAEVSIAEAAAVKSAVTQYLRAFDPAWPWPDAPIPDVKPAYSALFGALTGEVWVVRPGESRPVPGCVEEELDPTGLPQCWHEERVVDAFGPDGRYLGDVAVPDDLVLTPFGPRPFIHGPDVIGVVEDEEGTIRVKRYRLVLPESR